MDFTKVLTVDNNLRTITIPADVTLLGVTNDNNVHELVFAIPQTYNDIDLSDYTVYVNWMNAGGEIGVTETEVVQSDDPIVMLRKWIVGVDPCKYAGDCKFILCLKYGENEYNTQQAKLPVYKGIEPDEISVTRYRTALTELVERIQELAGKYAWDGTTWANFVKYDTTRKIAQESAAAARENATAAVNAKNTVVATKTQIDQYLEDLAGESNKISAIYEVLDRTNPNICPREYLEVNQDSTSGVINGNYQRFGHVYSGETYTFSADVTMSPLPGRLECRIKPDGGGANIEQVFYINVGSTGRIAQTFTAPGSGEIWFSGKMTGHAALEKVLEHCQLEEGDTASAYSPYGYFLVADAQARHDITTLREDVEGLDPFTSNILSVAHQGYSGYGATKNTLRAFKDAKKYGFDWIETDVYPTADGVMLIMHDGKVDTATETNVNVWTVNYADITSPTLKYSDAVNVCSMYGLGMAIELKGTNFDKNRGDYTYLINQVETKNVPHAFLSYNLSNLRQIRRVNYEQEVVLLLSSKPTATEIMTNQTYTDFYAILQQGGKVAIYFPFANNPIDQEYVDSLAQIGCGLIAGATETESTLAQYMKFCRMEVTDAILAKDIVQEYYP